MATVLDGINRSLRLLGVKEAGDSLAPEEANDAFLALNAMIDSWNNQSLLIYSIEDIAINLVQGVGDYTIGAGGDVNQTRPQRIESTFIRNDGTDWPMKVVNSEQYSRLWKKDYQATYPQYLYYESTFPLGTIKLFPVPSTGNELHIQVWNQLQAFTNLASEVSLPAGYQRMIDYNLAVEIAPEYGREPSPTVQKIAVDSMARIKIVNNKNAPAMRSPMRNIGVGGRGDFNISTLFNV